MTMKLVLLPLLTAAAIASAAVVPPPQPLNLIANPTIQTQPSAVTLTPSLLQNPSTNLSIPPADFPDKAFAVTLFMDAPFIGVNSVLMNLLYLMSLVTRQDFTEELVPRTYSTPGYRSVEIASYARTEARFLIWAAYYAANWMIKYARFHEVRLELLFKERIVGRMKVGPRRVLDLTGAGVQDLDALSDGGESDGAGSVVGNVTNSDLAAPIFNASAAVSLPPDISVDFEPITGARHVNRNDVFMAFYGAYLHVAHFTSKGLMQAFDSESPNRKLTLYMRELDIGCQYAIVNIALLYVPKYMLEHPNFGFRETEFVVKVREQPACLGSLIMNVGAGREGLERF